MSGGGEHARRAPAGPPGRGRSRGSIAAAAQRLDFTPSAVSQQIGKLERDLGCRLLERHPRGVTLTPVGQALLAHAETVVGELRAAEQAVQTMLGAEPARLAVGTFASAAQSLVPRALARFRRRHPDVALILLDLEPPDGYGLVSSGDLDLLITHRYPGVPLPDLRGLSRQLLMHDPLRLVLPAGHARRAARGSPCRSSPARSGSPAAPASPTA